MTPDVRLIPTLPGYALAPDGTLWRVNTDARVPMHVDVHGSLRVSVRSRGGYTTRSIANLMRDTFGPLRAWDYEALVARALTVSALYTRQRAKMRRKSEREMPAIWRAALTDRPYSRRGVFGADWTSDGEAHQ